MHFLYLLIFLFFLGVLAYHRVSPKLAIPSIAIILILYHFLHALSWPILLLLDLIFIAGTAIFSIKALRLQ